MLNCDDKNCKQCNYIPKKIIEFYFWDNENSYLCVSWQMPKIIPSFGKNEIEKFYLDWLFFHFAIYQTTLTTNNQQ